MSNQKNSTNQPEHTLPGSLFLKEGGAWWQEDGPFRALHRMTPARIEYIKEVLCLHWGLDRTSPRPFQSLRILDIGCGGGLVAEPLCRLGAWVTGLDTSESAIRCAQQHGTALGLDINYKVGSVDNFPGDGHKFDVLLALEILEHLPDVPAFLDQCRSLIRPGGLLILSTLHRNFRSFCEGILLAEYLLEWAPRGTHRWKSFIRPSELVRICAQAGFDTLQLRGLHFSPRHWAWRLIDTPATNYFLVASPRT